MKIICVKNLTLETLDSRSKILNNFTIEIESGQIHALVGNSGSGKSSFSYVLLNLIKKNFKVHFEKFFIMNREYNKITNWSELRGKDILYIPQNPADSFHPYLKIGTQIFDSLSKTRKNIKKIEIIEQLNRFSINQPERIFNSLPGFLSGGERQRVLLAISSLVQPKILIADEPTTALDPINEKLVLRDLIRLKKENNVTILLITHDRRIVRELADEGTVLKNGTSVEYFSMKDRGRFPDLQSEFSRNLLLERAV